MSTCYVIPVSVKKLPLKLPVICLGSSGSTVRILQQLLNFKGFTLEVNGEFNLRTQEAVKEFQQRKCIPAKGIVDAQTWYLLSVGLLPIE